MRDHVLLTREARGVATVTLNRPEKRNAFDAALVLRLHEVLTELANDTAVRVVVLTGAGSVFSAGADLDHMRRQGTLSEQENYEDALRLAHCLQTLDRLNKPVIARVNGAAYGGGIGLIACADIAIGVNTARFALTEVKLGIVPAVISPYVIRAVGERRARQWFLTAMPIDATLAQATGLLHEVVEPSALDAAIESTLDLLLQGGPLAQGEAKSLIREVGSLAAGDRPHYTAKLLAKLRASPEGKEGFAAFFDKRPAAWRVGRGS